ncbi:MAG: PaaX family transcriptional regulator, partial [Candidatus Binatia bacterium]
IGLSGRQAKRIIMIGSRTGSARPQHLLVTLLGDYWKGRKDHIPSAALVKILGEFEVSGLAARSALSRLTARGLLVRSQRGRRTFYGLTDRAQRTLDEGARRIFSFGATDGHWDGKWSVVAFSVAEADRDRRHVLRSRLRWLGFAPLYAGVWVSPRGDLERVAGMLDELGIEDATLFRAEALPRRGDGAGPLRAWSLAELRRRYQGFIRRFSGLRSRLRAGKIAPREALRDRTRLMDAWRAFPREDPELPVEFLPRDWPRREARALFLELYDGLGEMAERRVAELVAESSRSAP